jgi:hypothetical protein
MSEKILSAHKNCGCLKPVSRFLFFCRESSDEVAGLDRLVAEEIPDNRIEVDIHKNPGVNSLPQFNLNEILE